VLAAFGLTGSPEPLRGGTGRSWRCGDVVLKPVEISASVEELEWHAEVLGHIREDGFRIAAPVRTGDGAIVVDGWYAWAWLEGVHAERRWPEVIAVGGRLHAALAAVPRPSFLDRRTDPWAAGDRVAWEELPLGRFAEVKHVRRLAEARRPVRGTSQVVHGDLTGNVLFAEGLQPAVIDFAPYWRPAGFAAAVVVGDALLWEGADERLLDAVAHVDDFPQLLLRALIYRAVADAVFRDGEPARLDDDDCFLVPVELACALVR
jgi:uncharacterized protein (TIGR02569 family)